MGLGLGLRAKASGAVRNARFRAERMARKLRRIRCPVCGSGLDGVLYEAEPRWLESCPACGLGVALPVRPWAARASSQREVYSGRGYVDRYLEDYAPYLTNAFQRGLRRLSDLARPGSTLLDIGCGFGFFANMAREAGFAPEGIELSPALAEEARRRYGLRVAGGDLRDLGELDRRFDIVTAWDSLEHFADPVLALRSMTDLVRDEGLLLLRVPDFDPVLRDLPEDFLERYLAVVYPLDLDQHAVQFSGTSLDRLFRENGLSLVERWPSRENEYTPREAADYLILLAQMREFDVACEANYLCRKKSGV